MSTNLIDFSVKGTFYHISDLKTFDLINACNLLFRTRIVSLLSISHLRFLWWLFLIPDLSLPLLHPDDQELGPDSVRLSLFLFVEHVQEGSKFCVGEVEVLGHLLWYLCCALLVHQVDLRYILKNKFKVMKRVPFKDGRKLAIKGGRIEDCSPSLKSLLPHGDQDWPWEPGETLEVPPTSSRPSPWPHRERSLLVRTLSCTCPSAWWSPPRGTSCCSCRRTWACAWVGWTPRCLGRTSDRWCCSVSVTFCSCPSSV